MRRTFELFLLGVMLLAPATTLGTDNRDGALVMMEEAPVDPVELSLNGKGWMT